MAPHRADIRTPSGLVIELQHSSISAPEIADREEFYGTMLWLFDATPFLGNVAFSTRSTVSPPEVLFNWRHVRRTMRSVLAPLFWDLGDDRIVEVLEVPARGRRHGIGRPMHVNTFLAQHMADALVTPPPPPGRLLSPQRAAEALRAAVVRGHSFAAAEPDRAHECERCHLPLDTWIGEPNDDVIEKACVPRDPNHDYEVPF